MKHFLRPTTLLTKATAAQTEVALGYDSVRGLYFLAVVFLRTIVRLGTKHFYNIADGYAFYTSMEIEREDDGMKMRVALKMEPCTYISLLYIHVTVRPLLSAVLGRTKFWSQKPRIIEFRG